MRAPALNHLTRAGVPVRDGSWIAVAALGAVFALGAALGDIALAPAAAILAGAIAAGWLGSLLNAVRFDLKTTLLAALPLMILLHADTAQPLAAAGAIAAGSTFALRLGGRQVFNPAALGVVAATALFGAGLAAPWSPVLVAAALIAGLAAAAVAWRADAAFAFLASFAALATLGALAGGAPFADIAAPLHAGAIIVFAFFLLADPTTLPDWRPARVGVAALAALAAFASIHLAGDATGAFLLLIAFGSIRSLIDLARMDQRRRLRPAPRQNASRLPAE